MDVPRGTVVGNYEVLEPLGDGAVAEVYRIRHQTLDATYALKVLREKREDVTERLLNEGRVQASLRHPNVVGVTDVVRLDGHACLVLEYVNGPTLEDFVKEQTPIDLAEVDRIGLGILKGVRAAHSAGHLHRDLKPTNILMAWLGDEWIPKVADFGLAKVLHAHQGAVSKTRSGQIMGSPTFMAPEQCRDSHNVDERADVFALGAVLYELATGVRAFDAPDIVSVFTRIASGAFTQVDILRPDLPQRMVDAIHGALVVDPGLRIPDCATFIEVWAGRLPFEAALPDLSGSFTALLGVDMPQAEAAPEPKKKRKKRGVGIWAGMASVAAIVGTAVGLATGTALLVVILAGPLGLRRKVSEPVLIQVPDKPEPFDLTFITEPKPLVPEPTEPQPAPQPTQPAPQPTQPAPQPTQPAQPAPQPAQPAPPAPLAPASRPADAGRFMARGEARVRLVGGAGAFEVGEPVPEGSYFVEVQFEGDKVPHVLAGVQAAVEAGQTLLVRCDAMTRKCVAL